MAQVIAAWAERALPPRPERDSPEVEQGAVLVRETGESKFANEVLAGPHVLRADEPASLGGTDTGPGPYDLLLAGLGACTSMTLRLYAEHKGWPLERVSVALAHDKIHAQDCEECESRDGKLDRIARVIDLEGEGLSDAQRARLLEIADKCPVHRTLHSQVIVRTQLGPLG